MTELLSITEWRAKNIRWCPTCAEETLPLRDGTCGFCNTRLPIDPVPVLEAPGYPDGHCRMCGTPIQQSTIPGAYERFYCSRRHGKAYWTRHTEAGRAWQTENNRRRAERRRLNGREKKAA